MEEKMIFYDAAIMFKNERQFNDFVKFFYEECEKSDYLTWKTNTENRLAEAKKKGEKLVIIHPQLDLFLSWIEENPYANEKEIMAKLVTAIV